MLFVKKEGSSLRLCIDQGVLNKVAVENKYRLPKIRDLLDQLQGSVVCSKMDFKSGLPPVEDLG